MNTNQDNSDELLSQLQNQQQKQLQLLKHIELLEKAVKPYLSKDAITRYGTLKAAHPDKAIQALAVLAQVVQAKQITKQLTDGEFKAILMQLQQPKKEFKLNISK